MRPILYGSEWNVGVRSARIMLEERKFLYELAPRAALRNSAPGSNKVEGFAVVLEHNNTLNGGTDAILRYIDDVFPEQMPPARTDVQRLRFDDTLSLLLGPALSALGVEIVESKLMAAILGDWSNADLSEAIRQRASSCINALENILTKGRYFSGDRFSVADAAAASLFGLFMPLPEAGALINRRSPIREWWAETIERPSFAATVPQGPYLI